MFKHSSTLKNRAGKATKRTRRSYRDKAKAKMEESLDSPPMGRYGDIKHSHFLLSLHCSRLLITDYSPLTSPIVTIIVGHERRLFAAHEDVLSRSTYFQAALKDQFLEPNAKQVDLPDE
jgi:hypothetical protein